MDLHILKECTDGDLRRFLVEVQLLSDTAETCFTSGLHPSPASFLALLKAGDALVRCDGHTKLIAAVNSSLSGYSSKSVSKQQTSHIAGTAAIIGFPSKAVLHGLRAESIDLQRAYTEVLSELEKDDVFLPPRTESVRQICALLGSHDDVTRKHIADTLRGWAAPHNHRNIVVDGFLPSSNARRPTILVYFGRWPNFRLMLPATVILPSMCLIHSDDKTDDLRWKISKSDALILIITGANAEDEEAFKAGMQIFVNLANHVGVSQVVVTGLLELIGTHAHVDEVVLDTIFGFAHHFPVISTPETIEIILSLVVNGNRSLSRLAFETVLKLMVHDNPSH
ncbi:hypothetical protein B0H19DRAFT_1172913 [Mycena capillaripes]|nr:hypothetical protein B0H19DRAFT_1172913 [Mycena capillaripes]